MKRKIPTSKGAHVTGLYPSKKGPADGLEYESALERDCLIRLDGNASVVKLETQPVRIRYVGEDGKRRHYTPDILAHYANRRPRLLEVKYLDMLRRDREKSAERYFAASEYARRRGWSFRVVTERYVRRSYSDVVGAVATRTVPLRIEPGAEVVCGDEHHRILRVLDIGKVLAQPLAGGAPQVLAVSELRPDAETCATAAGETTTALEGVPEEEWREAERKHAIIKPLLGDRRRIRAEVEGVAERAGVSAMTIYRWLSDFNATGQVLSLLPKTRKDKGLGKLSEEAEAIIVDALETEYLTAQRRSVGSVLRVIRKRCLAAGLKPPHENTVRARIRQLDAKKSIRRRHGLQSARKLDMAPGRFPGAERALDVAQMDHSKLDIILVDEELRCPIGRPWLTLVMDIHSRAVLGFHVSLDAPGAASAGACIANAILPKERFLENFPKVRSKWNCWGKPRKLHMDNAGEFRGRMMRMACVNHGITLEWRPVRRPEYGGHIERIMGTIMREIHELPGSTFGSPKARGERDPERGAALTLRELEEWLAVFIVDIYHRRAHSETGRPPILLYEESVAAGRRLPDRETQEEQLRIDFLPVLTRSVQRRGVVIDGIHYYHFCLDTLRSDERKSVTLRRDPRDISRVYYYDKAAGDYVAIPYADVRRPPMNLWDLRRVRQAAKAKSGGEVNEDELFAAYERIRAQEEAGKSETKRARRERERRRVNAERPIVRKKTAEEDDDDDFPDIEILPYEDIEKLP